MLLEEEGVLTWQEGVRQRLPGKSARDQGLRNVSRQLKSS